MKTATRFVGLRALAITGLCMVAMFAMGCEKSDAPGTVATIQTDQATGPSAPQAAASDPPPVQAKTANQQTTDTREAGGIASAAALTEANVVIEPRTGMLRLNATDIGVTAGRAVLTFSRWHQATEIPGGLLGSRWRTNWDRNLIMSKELVAVLDGFQVVEFSTTPVAGEFRSKSGERLVPASGGGRLTRITLDGSKEVFDAKGRLLEREEPNGNKLTVKYDSFNRLARIDGPRGSFLQFDFDWNGRLMRVESSNGDVVRYSYTQGELTGVESVRGLTQQFAYDSSGRLSSMEQDGLGRTKFTYDAQGRVTSHVLANGSEERYEYDDAARVVRYINSAGGVTTIRRSEDGRQEEVTNPLGHKSVLEYDTEGRLVVVVGPTGQEARFTYDGQNRLTGVRDPSGETRLDYLGETGLITSVLEPDGTRAVFEYDTAHNLISIKVRDRTVTAFTYYPDGMLQRVRDQDGAERYYTYDEQGRRATISNGLGHATKYEYDRRGNLVRETNPLGGVTSFEYDARDRLVSSTDPNGNKTFFQGDAVGRTTRVIDPTGAETKYEYDALGMRSSVIDAAGRRNQLEFDPKQGKYAVVTSDGLRWQERYDAAGQLVEESNSFGGTTRYTHDILGRLLSQQLPTGEQISYQYDARGRIVGTESTAEGKMTLLWGEGGQLAEVKKAGASVSFRYDALGRPIGIKDPLGRETRFGYDKVDRLTEVKTPGGDTAQYQWDDAGQLTSLRRPSGSQVHFEYDGMGNLLGMTGSAGQVRHTYDASGARTSTTDAAGRTVQFSYDARAQLIEKQLPNGNRVKFQYTALGELSKADDGISPVEYEYDKAQRVNAVKYPAIGKSVRFETNEKGLRRRLITTAGQEVRYEYDGAGRLTTVVLPGGGSLKIAYDAAGRLGSVRYPNGVMGDWQYDGEGRVKALTYRDGTGAVLASWTYEYDAAGQPIKVDRTHGPLQAYQYDVDGRLAGETSGAKTTTYEYLPGGNRARRAGPSGAIDYKYDQADQIVSAGDSTFSHDASGNLIGRASPQGNTSYEYDADGRLIGVKFPNGQETKFGYSPTGERAWREDKNGRTRFIYDDLNLLEELDANGEPLALFVHAPGLDRPLAMLRGNDVYFYHADARGNVALLTGSNGQPAASYDFDAFGNLTQQTGQVSNPFVFAAREYEPALGLYYFRARYYDPTLGRFVSADRVLGSLDDPASLNAYAFARNAPTRYADPLGTEYMFFDYEYFGRYGISPQDIAARVSREYNKYVSRNPEMTGEKGLEFARNLVRSKLFNETEGLPYKPPTASNPVRANPPQVRPSISQPVKPEPGLFGWIRNIFGGGSGGGPSSGSGAAGGTGGGAGGGGATPAATGSGGSNSQSSGLSRGAKFGLLGALIGFAQGYQESKANGASTGQAVWDAVKGSAMATAGGVIIGAVAGPTIATGIAVVGTVVSTVQKVRDLGKTIAEAQIAEEGAQRNEANAQAAFSDEQRIRGYVENALAELRRLQQSAEEKLVTLRATYNDAQVAADKLSRLKPGDRRKLTERIAPALQELSQAVADLEQLANTAIDLAEKEKKWFDQAREPQPELRANDENSPIQKGMALQVERLKLITPRMVAEEKVKRNAFDNQVNPTTKQVTRVPGILSAALSDIESSQADPRLITAFDKQVDRLKLELDKVEKELQQFFDKKNWITIQLLGRYDANLNARIGGLKEKLPDNLKVVGDNAEAELKNIVVKDAGSVIQNPFQVNTIQLARSYISDAFELRKKHESPDDARNEEALIEANLTVDSLSAEWLESAAKRAQDAAENFDATFVGAALVYRTRLEKEAGWILKLNEFIRKAPEKIEQFQTEEAKEKMQKLVQEMTEHKLRIEEENRFLIAAEKKNFEGMKLLGLIDQTGR